MQNGAVHWRSLHFRQAFKTGLAGILCVWLTDALKLSEGYWAAISAVIVMQSHLGGTLNASWNRLAATAVGASLGAAFTLLWGRHALAFGIAVMLAIMLCGWLRLAESARIAATTVAIVMLIGRAASPWTIAMHRFLEVSIGILVALAVTVAVWPSHATAHLREGIADLFRLMSALLQAAVRRLQGEANTATIDSLRLEIDVKLRKNDEFRRLARYERAASDTELESIEHALAQINRLLPFVEVLEASTRASAGDTFHERFRPEVDGLVKAVVGAFSHLAQRFTGAAVFSPWPDFDRASAPLDEKIKASRAAGLSQRYPLEEVLRFHTLLLSLTNIVRELKRSKPEPSE
jgi:uncharacterized membrane protein YgaE (UPF0421/DUF939 family)